MSDARVTWLKFSRSERARFALLIHALIAATNNVPRDVLSTSKLGRERDNGKFAAVKPEVR